MAKFNPKPYNNVQSDTPWNKAKQKKANYPANIIRNPAMAPRK